MIIGEQLRTARVQSGMSQEQLAEVLAVSRQTISNWENSRSYSDIERVMRMSELYHLSLDEMLRGDERMVKSWMDAADTVKTGKKLGLVLALNILLTIGIVAFEHSLWLTGALLAVLVGCVATAFYLTIKLI